MRAILLAAGFGTRLRPLTNSIPKCLVPIHGRPLLGIWLDRLLASGAIERVLVNTHYLSDRVEDFIAGSPWKDRVTLVYEKELLGTGGTVLRNREWTRGRSVLVAHADNLTLFDVNAFIATHMSRPPQCLLTMMTFDTDSPETCGIVEEHGGIVFAFHEKVVNPPGIRANAAVYIIEPEVIENLSTKGTDVIDISTEVLPSYMGRIATFHNATYHRDIGNLQSLQAAEMELCLQDLNN